MKFLLILSIIVSSSLKFLYCQGHCELFIENNSPRWLYIKIYPVSMVFNWPVENQTFKPGYNLISNIRRTIYPYYRYDFINGANYYYDPQNPSTNRTETVHKINAASRFCGQSSGESGGSLSETDICFGYGKYRIDFWWRDASPYIPDTNLPPNDYCIVEFDAEIFKDPEDDNLAFVFTDIEPRIVYNWSNNYIDCNEVPLPPDRFLKSWEACPNPNTHKQKNYGYFKYDKGTAQTPNPYTVLPQDPRMLCTSAYFPGAPYQNHYYQENNIGLLTLNLTIEKNDANGNPVEITTPTSAPFSYPPPINIAGYDPVQQKGATLTLAKGTNNHERVFRFKKYSTGNYGTNLSIGPKSILELSSSTSAADRAHVIFESYCNTEVEAYGILLMRSNSMITLTGNSFMRLMPNAWLTQHSGSEIEIRDNATLMNCGAKFFVLAPIYHLFNNGHYIISNTCPFASIEPYISEVDSGGSITLSDNSVLTIEAYNKIIFDGSESYLKAEPGTTIEFGEGTSIEFRNGAYIDADGCSFTNLNSGDIWSGIKLDGAGPQSVIRNCTFNNAVTAIDIENTQCSISDNQINVPENVTGAAGITATNAANIVLQHNTINLGYNASATGISFLNYDSEGAPGGGGSSYSLNIVNNFINGGAYPITISCLTASQLPFYIYGNQINPVNGINSYGLFAYNITGNIKVNSFNNSYSSQAVTLQQCNVNMFDNFFQTNLTSMTMQSSSTAQMAPIQNLYTQWLWIGGNNSINSNLSNCVSFSSGSNPIISPRGNNCFTVNTQPNYHITGEYCLSQNYYDAYNNFWDPAVSSQSFDINCESQPVPVMYTPYYSECPLTIGDVVGYEIEDMGNGIYDTVYITSGGGGGSYPGSIRTMAPVSPGALYYEALSKRKLGDFAGAILKCKEIINYHDTSRYFMSALSELYLNYLESDTINNQNITNGLFSSLKTYLSQKMQQYQNNIIFVERAYKYFLMCLVKKRNFSEAIAGYEIIMNNHPDPVVRLNASWDRSAVILLMGQGGGKDSRLRGNDNSRSKKLLDKNPAHRIASEVFEKENAKEDRQSANNEKVSNVKYTKEEKSRINVRVEKFNPLNKIDLLNKINSDVKLLNDINVKKSEKVKDIYKPVRFNLYQNYPNPFNPITEISYDLPKSAYVSLKIYNALGELMNTLVNNEYKPEGRYTVKFDGTNFASGIYFYSLWVSTPSGETKDYKATRKMVLIK